MVRVAFAFLLCSRRDFNRTWEVFLWSSLWEYQNEHLIFKPSLDSRESDVLAKEEVLYPLALHSSVMLHKSYGVRRRIPYLSSLPCTMSGLCFPTSSDVNGTITQIIKATDLQYVEYWGSWKEQQDSQEFYSRSQRTLETGQSLCSQVNTCNVPRASFLTRWLIGVAVQVVARVDSSGIQSTFGLDFDGSENGGVTCETDSGAVGAAQQNIPLFDSVPREPSPGTHTLFITNNGPPLSLASFLIFGIMETTTSTLEHTESILPPFSTLPQPTGTNLSSKTLILPLPNPTATSPPDTQQESPSLSHTISSSTTTVVIQTTVEASATSRLRGISQYVLGGAVVGGALLPLLLVGVSLWWRRRRSRLLSLKHMAGSVSGTSCPSR